MYGFGEIAGEPASWWAIGGHWPDYPANAWPRLMSALNEKAKPPYRGEERKCPRVMPYSGSRDCPGRRLVQHDVYTMPFVSLMCPQCAAPLPRAAYWRTVTCSYCGATVSRGAETIRAASFHEAWLRVHQAVDLPARMVSVGERQYGLLAGLGGGESSQVFLAQRVHPFGERVTLKLARTDGATAVLQQEAETVRQLQGLKTAGSAYFSQRLPQLVASGTARDGTSPERHALALRHPTGFWGSLADVMRGHPTGVDARHAVWMWRRVLEVLAYLHDNSWQHGDLCPEHLLVHPRNHGVQMIGWARARHGGHGAVQDLMQLAWSIRMLLSGQAGSGEHPPSLPATTPAPLAALLLAGSEDARWCAQHGARGLLAQLGQAAEQSFGVSRFVVFHPTAASALH